MTRIAVLASGRGSNLGRLIEAARSGGLPVEVALVAADRECPALELARSAGIAIYGRSARVIGMEAWEQGCLEALRREGVALIVLAGFMRVLRGSLLHAYPRAILNLHPSLLPAFAGQAAVRQALAHGVRVTGATVHLVDETLDGGPILLQEAVPVLQDDDEESLTARIQEVEHRLLPEAVRLLAEGRVLVEGRRTKLI